MRVCLITASLALVACGDNTDAPADGGPDAALVGQGSEPTGDFVVNEVAPRGEGADWLELVNRGGEPLDLCNYFVTDSLDRLDHYLPLGGAAPPDACEPVFLGAGDYLVIEADDSGEVGHAPFRLGVADEVHIVDLGGRAVDSLVYLHDAAGSLARVPDGAGLFFAASPTPGVANPEVNP